MNRFERLLLPVIAIVMAVAILLEGASASTVRVVAITFGIVLVVLLAGGMVHRFRRGARASATPPEAQTSNDPADPGPG